MLSIVAECCSVGRAIMASKNPIGKIVLLRTAFLVEKLVLGNVYLKNGAASFVIIRYQNQADIILCFFYYAN